MTFHIMELQISNKYQTNIKQKTNKRTRVIDVARAAMGTLVWGVRHE